MNITLNSIGTELTRDDRRKLYSNFGLLYPHGHTELAGAEDFDQIRSAMEKCPPYQAIFNKVWAPLLFVLKGSVCDDSACSRRRERVGLQAVIALQSKKGSPVMLT